MKYSAMNQDFAQADVSIRFRDGILSLENACVRRIIDFRDGLPRTISLLDRTSGGDLVSPDRPDYDFSFMGYNQPQHAKTVTSYAVVECQIVHEPGTCLMPEHVVARLHLREPVQSLELVREYTLFPGQPYLISRAAIRCPVLPAMYWTRRGGLHRNDNFGIAEYASTDPSLLESVMDSLCFRVPPETMQSIGFHARTDYTNDLLDVVAFSPGETPVCFNGNICLCGFAPEQGLFFLQEAPHSDERRDFESHDFRYERDTLYSVCWGIQPHEVRPDKLLWGYRHVIGLYRGDADEGARAIRNYQACRFPRDWSRDGAVMVNPWGGGQFQRLMSESFLIDEVRASAEIGATHYQIDDGWERGGTLREFTVNNRAITADFWQLDPDTFPNGFEPLTEVARESKVELALWIAPTSNQQHRDWQALSAILLKYHLRYGFRHIKFDGIAIKTKEAEDNFEALLEALRSPSNGDMIIDFDLTNGQRNGYLLYQEYGIVFLENRYVCHNWGMLYHPETVLHTIWRLARFLRLQNIQIECTDPAIINHDYFRQREVRPPDIYEPEYWAALTLFGNPLLWLSPSRLEPETRRVYRKVMDLHAAYRQGIFAGDIQPVGQEPNGAALTGFQSHQKAADAGYLILYREYQAPPSIELQLKSLGDRRYTFKCLNEATRDLVYEAHSHSLTVTIERPGSYRLYAYESE